MEAIFSPEYKYAWALVLAIALYIPVRNLIYALMMRRAARKGELEEGEALRLKKRASVTSALLCFAFAFLYAGQLFNAP